MSDPFSTKDARPERMSTELADWCDQGAPEERRTLILRLDAMADPGRITKELVDLDIEVVSSGAAVIVGNVACRNLRAASELEGVLRLDESTRLQEKAADTLRSGPASRKMGYTLPE